MRDDDDLPAKSAYGLLPRSVPRRRDNRTPRVPDEADSPVRAFLRSLEGVTRSILQASDAGAVADVEGMLDLLHQQVGALTPWSDAHICTSCWHAIPPVAMVHPGGDHRGMCATCWERQHADDPPSDADLWDGGDAILGEN
jgi:hypothetical protein